MIGKLTEPNLTRRLALLAEARRDSGLRSCDSRHGLLFEYHHFLDAADRTRAAP
jgi:hypothetical protein